MKMDHCMPFPFDYVMDRELQIEDYKQIVAKILSNDSNLKELNIINGDLLKKFEGRKRMYVFIVPTNTFGTDDFKLERMWQPDYLQEVLQERNLERMRDFASLSNALRLVNALKQERIARELYILKDSHSTFRSNYPFLMSSHLKQLMHVLPPVSLEFHNGLSFA